MRDRRLALCCAVLALLVPAASAASAPPGNSGSGTATEAARAPRLIIAPTAGVVARAPVRVILGVSGRYTLRDLTVTLNGRNTTAAFRRVFSGRRVAALSASHGLRFGRNVLRVRLRASGGVVRRQAVTFTLSRQSPLVGAGLGRRVAIGTVVRLDARTSRPRPGAAPGGPGILPLSTSWRVVRRPRGSGAVLRVSGRRDLRPVLRPDRVGRYVLRLTVKDRLGTSAPAEVEVLAVPPTPLVPVASSVDGTNPLGAKMRGIAVGYHPGQEGYRPPDPANGEQFYPLPSGDDLLMVALDWQTLEPVPGGVFSGPAGVQTIAGLKNAVGSLPPGSLVVVSSFPDPSWGSLVAPLMVTDSALASIGAGQPSSPFIDAFNQPMEKGHASWIGVTGFSPGQAFTRVTSPNMDDGTPRGLSGYLSPDSNANFTYLDDQPQPFDLGPDGQSVSMSIGGAAPYTASLPAGQGGFAVLYLAGATLVPYAFAPPFENGGQPYVFTTRNADGSANTDGMNAMSAQLSAARNISAPLVIVIRSIGSPIPVNVTDGGVQSTINTLAFNIGQAGGKSQYIWRMATGSTAPQSYSLVGQNGLNEGQAPAVDVSSTRDPAPTSTRLWGEFQRNHQSVYEARQSGVGSPINEPLSAVLFADPTPWPYSSSTLHRAALSCIGSLQGMGSPDPRTSYWTQTWDQGKWNDVKGDIAGMTPAECPQIPDTRAGRTAFAQVQGELVQEISWIVSVRSYFDSLSEPITSDSSTSITNVDQIITDIEQSIPYPPAQNAGINGWSIVSSILDAADYFEVPGASLFSALFNFGGSFTAQQQGSATLQWRDKVVAAGDALAADVEDQLQAMVASNRRVSDIIFADYGKLKTVGTLGGCTPGPGCPAAWSLSQDQQAAMAKLLNVSIKQQAWAGLLPVAYPYVLYVNSNPGSFNGTFEGPQTDIRGVGCGFYQQFNVTPPVDMQFGFVQPANTNFLVFAQQNFSGGGGAQSPTLFPQNTLFTGGTSGTYIQPPFTALGPSPASTDRTLAGGLGMDRYAFMMENYPWGSSGTPTRFTWKGCGS